MADTLIWGTFGDVVFQFLTSPQRGTVRRNFSAKYTERPRIISRGADGALKGQKPLKDTAGLGLDRVSFTCKITSLILKTLSIKTEESLALAVGAGPYVGSALGTSQDDERFRTDVLTFIDILKQQVQNQTPEVLTKGVTVLGMFTIDDLDITETDKTNGEPLTAEIKINLTEWVPE